MDLKWTMKNLNAMFAMRTLTTMRVQFVVYEYVHHAMHVDTDANVLMIGVDLIGNLLDGLALILLMIFTLTRTLA